MSEVFELVDPSADLGGHGVGICGVEHELHLWGGGWLPGYGPTNEEMIRRIRDGNFSTPDRRDYPAGGPSGVGGRGSVPDVEEASTGGQGPGGVSGRISLVRPVGELRPDGNGVIRVPTREGVA